MILVVEDDAVVREVVREVLALGGYDVISATSGEEALQLATEHRVALDLVVTDVVMPGIGGGEVARRVAEGCPGTPVLFMSGYSDSDLIEQGVRSEQVPFLRKPFTPDSLLSKVRELLTD